MNNKNYLFLTNSLGSYQSEGESSRPPSGRRLTPIENAPLLPDVIPSPPSGVVSLYHNKITLL